ncbi:vanin-like protein 2 [Cimex lectularius]|uniref:CN hydrolase domain-containing protein n=1 Tax=Cimex lectularius TaxID=79782 RepID=A0A8I6S7X4_CIMLE|nr:vanin-like protein 2 [Cimex lectularius]
MWRASLLCILLIQFVRVSLQSTAADDHYVAAVVEYHSIWDIKSSPRENVIANANKYAEVMKMAALNKVDIIVFPEIGLMNYDRSVFVEVPDPEKKVTPAEDSTQDLVLQIISKAAKDNSMYVVVNLHEIHNASEITKYNTNVVLDRSGTIIARYRKFNLFGEAYLNITKEPEIETFTTDFGVKFGMFICFDILFASPAFDLARMKDVHDIVFPSAWFSELPFLTAIQAQSSWSFATDINLLAANHNDVILKGSGSGLYRGLRMSPTTSQTNLEGTFVIIGKMPKKGFSYSEDFGTSDQIKVLGEPTEISMTWLLKENANLYKSELISSDDILEREEIISDGLKVGAKLKKKFVETVCQENLCCEFNITFTSSYYSKSHKPKDIFNALDSFHKFRYRVVVLDGSRKYVGVKRTSGLDVCGIVSCVNSKQSSCFDIPKENDDNQGESPDGDLYSTSFDSISISTVYSNTEMLIMPNILHSTSKKNTFGTVPKPKEFLFMKTAESSLVRANLYFHSPKLITGGLYTRVFSRDSPYPLNQSSVNNLNLILFILVVTVFFMVK